jgi:hypothetical protein
MKSATASRERRCAALWCDHLVYGPPQQRFCRTEHCDRARDAERQRQSRKIRGDDLTALERQERQELLHARLAGYVGTEAFGKPFENGVPRTGHALSFLWKFGLVDGSDPGELDALLSRTCRCNGHHIDGGAVGCFKCGLSR